MTLYVNGAVRTRNLSAHYEDILSKAWSAFRRRDAENGKEHFKKLRLFCGGVAVQKEVEAAGKLYVGVWDIVKTTSSLRVVDQLLRLLAEGRECGLFLNIGLVPLPEWVRDTPKVHELTSADFAQKTLQIDSYYAALLLNRKLVIAEQAENSKLVRDAIWLRDKIAMAGVWCLRDEFMTWEQFVEASPACYIAYYDPQTPIGEEIRSVMAELRRSKNMCAYYEVDSTQLPLGYLPSPRIWRFLDAKLYDDDYKGFNLRHTNQGLFAQNTAKFTKAVTKSLSQRTQESNPRDISSQSPGDLVGNYYLKEQIGNGTSGVVFRGQSKDGKEVAIKVATSKKGFQERELRVLKASTRQFFMAPEWSGKRLHRNLLLLLDHYIVDRRLYCITELCTPGSLHKFLANSSTGLTEPVVRHFTIHIANALAYLCEKEVIHRDLKPDNILLHDNLKRENPPPLELLVKLADFGTAKFLPSVKRSLEKTWVGSRAYMAPEMLLDVKTGLTYAVDRWAVGVILYECVEKRLPFEDSQLKTIYKDAMQIDNIADYDDLADRGLLTFSDNVSKTLRDLICNLLKVPDYLRLSLSDFMHHPFLCEAFEEDTFREANTQHETVMQWALNNDVELGQLFDINACTPLKYYVPSDHSDFPSRKKPARLEWCSGWQFHSRETSPFEQMTSFGRFRCAVECELNVLTGLQATTGFGRYFSDSTLRNRLHLAYAYMSSDKEELIEEDVYQDPELIFPRVQDFGFLRHEVTHLVSSVTYGFCCIVAVTLDPGLHLTDDTQETLLKAIQEKLPNVKAVNDSFANASDRKNPCSISCDSLVIHVYADPIFSLKAPIPRKLDAFISHIRTRGPELAKNAALKNRSALVYFRLTPVHSLLPKCARAMNILKGYVKLDKAQLLRLTTLLHQLDCDATQTEAMKSGKQMQMAQKSLAYSSSMAAAMALSGIAQLRSTIARTLVGVRRGREQPAVLDTFVDLHQTLKAAFHQNDTTDQEVTNYEQESEEIKELDCGLQDLLDIMDVKYFNTTTGPHLPDANYDVSNLPVGFVGLVDLSCSETCAMLDSMIQRLESLTEGGHACTVIDLTGDTVNELRQRYAPPRIMEVQLVDGIPTVADDNVDNLCPISGSVSEDQGLDPSRHISADKRSASCYDQRPSTSGLENAR